MILGVRTLLVPLVLSCLLSAGEGPTLAPQAGTRVSRVLEHSVDLSLDGWHVVWNDTPVPGEFLPELEIETSDVTRVELEDEYLACAGGQVERLRRHVLSVEASSSETSNMDGEPVGQELERDGESDLEGCLVLFEQGGSQRELEEGDCSDASLEGLVLDLDLMNLLAPEGVERGEDGWEFELNAIAPLDVAQAFAVELEEDSSVEERGDRAQLDANAQGSWKVRPAGTREEDGLQLDVFELEGEVETEAERKTDLAEVPIVDGAATEVTNMTYTYEGELLWDRAGARLHSADLRAEIRMTLLVTRDLEGVAGEPTYNHQMDFSGTAVLTIRTKVLP